LVSSAPVTHKVVTHLRRLIQRRRLRPGDRLPTERELAQGMGVSRPSVRAALHFLTAMGVIRSRQGAGTFIQEGPPSLDSEPLSLLAALHGFTVEEMFEARGALEVNVAGLSAQRASGEQRAAMAEEVASMFASLGDPAGFLIHDVRFHRAVAAGSNNPVLAALVDMVSALLYERRRDTIEGARDLRESAEMHRRIYQAVRRGDATQARNAMAEHLRLAQEAWAEEDARSGATRPGSRGAARRRATTRRK
jgi:GntR family transcriptional regulator, transcriptional repressor for pyruvate dehydrogenase complex